MRAVLCGLAVATVLVAPMGASARQYDLHRQDPTVLNASRADAGTFVHALVGSCRWRGFEVRDKRNFYSARTTGLWLENRRLNEPAIGLPDEDWICDREDWEKFKVDIEPVGPATETSATFRVSVRDDRIRARSFVLVREADGWRVDDILTPESLIAFLEETNRDAAANPPAEWMTRDRP